MRSREFDVAGVAYRAKRLSAYDQFAIFRRLTPILPALSGLDLGMRVMNLKPALISALFAPLRDVGDDELDAVFSDCLAAIERADGAAVGTPGVSSLLSITMSVVAINFGPLFAMTRPQFEPCPPSDKDKGYGDLGPVAMPAGKDWLFAPMHAGLCRYTDLKDGTLQIEDIAEMSDALSVRSENEARLRYVAEQD